MGRRKEESIPHLPSHRPLRTRYRNSHRRPFRDRLQDWVRVSSRVAGIVSHMDAVSFRNGYQQWWTKYISLYKKHLDLTSSPQFHFIFVIYLHYILLSIITFLQLRWHLLNFRLKEANLVRNNDNHDTELGTELCSLYHTLNIQMLFSKKGKQ